MYIYVFGLGHVGLPMACFAALRGKKVIGIDTNPEVIKNIKKGKIKMHEYYRGKHISQIAKELMEKEQFSITDQFTRAEKKPGVFIISVGIKSSKNFQQDISPLKKVTKKLLPNLINGDLIIFRTTMYPGLINNLIIPRIKNLESKIYLAYCPETILETRAFEELNQNPVIIAGMNDKSFKKAKDFFTSISKTSVKKASKITTAEMVKVVQNISRDVNIALINEISKATKALNVNVYELCSLANTHPRINLLKPGPGVGGYCLPNAFIYLKMSLNKNNFDLDLPLIETARKCNLQRPEEIIKIIKKALQKAGKNIKESKIAVAGLAMKDNCTDYRYSPALTIIDHLSKSGANVQAYDPAIDKMFSCQTSTLNKCIKDTDCLVITAQQPDINFYPGQIIKLMNQPPIVVDTRNCFPVSKKIKLYKL